MRNPMEAIRAELARLGLTLCPVGTPGAIDPASESLVIAQLAEIADVAVTLSMVAEWNDGRTPTVQDQTYANLVARTKTSEAA